MSEKYVCFADLTPAQRFHKFMEKGAIVPDPFEIFGANTPPDLTKQYRETRILYDRLMQSIADAACPDLNMIPRKRG